MKKVVLVLVVAVTTLFSCEKKKVDPKLKNVLFTAEVTRFKDGTTWTVVNNPIVNNK